MFNRYTSKTNRKSYTGLSRGIIRNREYKGITKLLERFESGFWSDAAGHVENAGITLVTLQTR